MAPTTTARRTQRQRREATVETLLVAAVDGVLDHGAGVSTAEIARRAGVSKGALQHHFASKAELLAAVVDRGFGDLEERLAELPTASVCGTVEAVVDELIAATWESYSSPASRAAFVVSSDRRLDAPLGALLASRFHDQRARLDATWSRCLGVAGVPADHAAAIRRYVRSHLLGMLAQRELIHAEPAVDDELAQLATAAALLLQAGIPHRSSRYARPPSADAAR